MTFLSSFKKIVTSPSVNMSAHVADEMARAAQALAEDLPHKSLELKVKLRELGGEARIIKEEEQRVLGYARALFKREVDPNRPLKEWADKHVASYFNLRNHRTTVVREEQRATFLAYGFLRGRSYIEIEGKRYSQPAWDRIEAMVTRYGPPMGSIGQQVIRQRLAEWRDGAPALSAPKVRKPRMRKTAGVKKSVDTA